MKRGLTAAFTTWLALIALQTFATSSKAAGRVGELFADVNSVVERALDPNVAAIPDRRAGKQDAQAPASTSGTKNKSAAATAPTTTRGATLGAASPLNLRRT